MMKSHRILAAALLISTSLMVSLALVPQNASALNNPQPSKAGIQRNFLVGAFNTANNSTNNQTLISQSPSHPLASNNAYTNNTDGITVTVPQGWGAEAGRNAKNDTLLTAIHITPPLSQDPNALVNVRIYKDTRPATNNSVSQYLRDEMVNSRDVLNNFKMGSASTNISIAGQPGYQLQFSYNGADSTPRRALETGTLLHGNGYYVYYVAPPDLFLKLLPQVNQIVQSLKVNPP